MASSGTRSPWDDVHELPAVTSSTRHLLDGASAAPRVRLSHDRGASEWSQQFNAHEEGAQEEAQAMEQQLKAALLSSSHLGTPNPFRTAICFDVLAQISGRHERLDGIMSILQDELIRGVYVIPPSSIPVSTSSCHAQADRVQRFFAQQTYFSQLQQVIQKKAKLQSRLDGMDAMHALMLKQLRHEERMVDKVATRWARVVLRQTLVDWKKIIVRKKYTRVLLEKTSARWVKQRQLRVFRKWVEYAKRSKLAKVREMIQQCGDQTRDFEELLTRMETQIEGAKSEARLHREHYDFAKRQILSLEELFAQLEQRVHDSNERKLQEIVNEWGRLCLTLVDCQLDFLSNMVHSLPLDLYADPSLLLVKGEELTDLLRLPADALVLRWINFHLSKSTTFQYYESSPTGFIQNFSSDMKNNYVLRHLLHRVIQQKRQLAALRQHKPESTNTPLVARHPSMNYPMQAPAPGSRKATPYATKEDLRSALEFQLLPPCPPFLSAQTAESDMPSDLAFALFSFLACEHASLVPTASQEKAAAEQYVCPWKEAQLALTEARDVWSTIRAQWTELQSPFAVREIAAAAPDLTSPPHLLVRGNIAMQNAVNTVQYACSKRSVVMKVWNCLHRTIQQDAMRVLVCRGRQEPPWEMMDRRLSREKYMLTTLHFAKLASAFASDDSGGTLTTKDATETELQEIEHILREFYDELRRMYRYYASIDAELQRTDHLLRHHKAGTPVVSAEAQAEARFFRKISLSMSLLEFHVFLKDCRVFGTARPFPYEFIERVFEQVNEDVAATAQDAHTPIDDAMHDHNVSEMTPGEFVEALVHVARSKYVRFRHPAQVASMSLAQRFRRMLVDVVLPNAMQERERVNVFHEQLLTPPCREVFAKHQRTIHAVYVCFAQVGSLDDRRKQNRMLSVNGFVVLLKHFGLLRENFLNLDEVQHVLSEVLGLERDGVQFDLDAVTTCLANLENQNCADHENYGSNHRHGDNCGHLADELLFITYAEFLEVLSAIACYLRPDAFVPLADKLDDFLTQELRGRSLPNQNARDKI